MQSRRQHLEWGVANYDQRPGSWRHLESDEFSWLLLSKTAMVALLLGSLSKVLNSD
jgi:hypothetical protein